VTPADLSAAIVGILNQLQTVGQLAAGELPAEVVIERPKNREHGDWATNAALQLAKNFGTNPRALAQSVAEHLSAVAGVAKIDIAGPGFLNITLDAAAAG